MIELSNGHRFEYMTASGALAYDGRGWPWEKPLVWMGKLKAELFTPVTKSLTRDSRKGNMRWSWPYRCIRHLPNGELNAVGLSNPGIDWWMRVHAPTVDCSRLPLVASIFSNSLGELSLMAELLDRTDIVAIELNASCPNDSEQMFNDPVMVVAAARIIQQNSRHPLIVKLSPIQPLERVTSLLSYLPQAYSINSVHWHEAYPGRRSPLAHLGGGAVSGRDAQKWTWDAVRRLKASSDVPVIGPGVWEYEDISRLRDLGADAISFGSVFIRRPWAPTAWVERELAERGGA